VDLAGNDGRVDLGEGDLTLPLSRRQVGIQRGKPISTIRSADVGKVPTLRTPTLETVSEKASIP
jgi:hypothetical protein